MDFCQSLLDFFAQGRCGGRILHFFPTYILRTISSFVHIVILHVLDFFVNQYSINFLHSCLDCNYIFPGVAETFSKMSSCTIWFHKYVIEPVESYFSKTGDRKNRLKMTDLNLDNEIR